MSSPASVRLELHCHTRFSFDGLMTFQSLQATAQAVGLDAVAITDHDTIEGALNFRELARQQNAPVTVIVGEERTLDDGSHFIGLFLERPIVSAVLTEVVLEIEAQGGLCLIPHPFRRRDGLLRNGLEPLNSLANHLVGFELFSAKCAQVENERARELLSTAFGPFGGSDAHYECDLGESWNEIVWQGDWRRTVEMMLRRTAPFQIRGKPQSAGEEERKYAPAYYRLKKRIGMPKALVPAAKQIYRRYRNWRFGTGAKSLREIYRHG